MLISLTRGFYAIVDDDLDPVILNRSWYASGSDGRPARRSSLEEDDCRRLIFLYHDVLEVLPWDLRTDGLVVDHIDRNPLNNVRANLRIVTQTVNMRNTLRSLEKKGICYDKRHNRYKAYIDRYDMPRINVGTYLTKEQAEIALAAAKEALCHAHN